MRIVLVTPDLVPLSGKTGAGAEVAALATALLEHGHEVRAVLPLGPEIDPSAHSLARRLKPIVIEDDGRTVSFGRFDGRTPQGVEVHLLGIDPLDDAADRDPAFWRHFAAAAAVLLAALPAADTCCIACDPRCATVAGHDRGAARAARVHLLSIDRLDDRAALGAGDLAHFDRIALVGGLADHCRAEGPEPLHERLLDGSAVRIPRGVQNSNPVELHHKASAKVALQTSLGLPVRADVPLIVFPDREPGQLGPTLKRLLRGDVQAIAFGDEARGELAELAERYPDRLALVPDGIDQRQTLVGVDACVVFEDATLTSEALACGTVPVVDQRLADEVVDLEPTLESGSAVLFDAPTAESVGEGLDRLVAAFHTGQPFGALAQRIQGYATPWPAVAELYLQLIQLA